MNFQSPNRFAVDFSTVDYPTTSFKILTQMVEEEFMWFINHIRNVVFLFFMCILIFYFFLLFVFLTSLLEYNCLTMVC